MDDTISTPFFFSFFFITFKQGESVCAPTIEKPLPGLYWPPTTKATMADPLRVKKYFPLRSIFQLSRSLISLKPAAINNWEASWVAWKGEGELLTNSINSWAVNKKKVTKRERLVAFGIVLFTFFRNLQVKL